MRCSLSCLQNYFQKPISIAKLHNWLQQTGIEIEKIKAPTLTFNGVVIAEVTEAVGHPNADSLKVATVFDGTNTRQIVCGAANCRAGIRVACALPGAFLDLGSTKPFKIKKSKLRGIESDGMLCAYSELQLPIPDGKSDEGIIELPSNAPLGENVEILFSDPIIEFALTPNISRCNSFLGLAREIAFFVDNPVIIPPAFVEENLTPFPLLVDADSSIVENYAYQPITGISLIHTPTKYTEILENAGIKSINPIVDLTNFVMLETGHPLHAFDADTIYGDKIFIRPSLDGESFTSINGQLITLPAGLPLIADSKKILALAGVIGSAESMITERTKNVLLEAAVFPARLIRQSSRQTQIQTEASYRYVRNIDPESTIFALNRVASLIAKYTSGTVHKKFTAPHYTLALKTVSIRPHALNKILGTTFSTTEIIHHLKLLDFTVSNHDDTTITVSVPSYRHDISIEADLIEEVLRSITFKKLPQGNPYPSTYRRLPSNKNIFIKKQLRNILLGEQLQEITTCDLVANKENKIFAQDLSYGEVIPLLSNKQDTPLVLRSSLLPGLLKTASYNLCRKIDSVKLFEMGTTYLKRKDKFSESLMLGLLLAGNRYEPNCFDKDDVFSFFDLKGLLENLFKKIHLPTTPLFEKSSSSFLHPCRQAKLILNSKEIGVIGEIHPLLLKDFDITVPVIVAEFSSLSFADILLKVRKFVTINPFPAINRDLTLSVISSLPAGKILELAGRKKSKNLENVRVTSIYQNDNLNSQVKNVSLRMTYREKERTLSAQEAEKEHNAVAHSITEELKKQDLIKEM